MKINFVIEFCSEPVKFKCFEGYFLPDEHHLFPYDFVALVDYSAIPVFEF